MNMVKENCLYFKIIVNKSPNYLYNYVSTVNQSYQTRSSDKFLHIRCRKEYFGNSLIPYSIKEWDNSILETRKSVSHEVFKNSLLKFKRSSTIVYLIFLIVLKSKFLLDYV